MTIHCKELIIRATVEEQSSKQKKSDTADNKSQAQLIEACVEQILEILRKQRER